MKSEFSISECVNFYSGIPRELRLILKIRKTVSELATPLVVQSKFPQVEGLIERQNPPPV